MYTLPNFCRVCLKYDKNLIDLEHIENEPNETLLSKLQQCVAEVEWKVFKPLLCHPCIKRLNIAYTFKKQCVQSATMLKSYVALVTKNKSEQEAGTKDAQSNAYMMLPNQKYIKIVMAPQNQNTYQNVFLNVVPTPPLNPLSPENKNNKDTNQNVFLNINNTFQKYVPVAPEPPKNLSVSQLLTESKSEELSVEIDPTDFGLGDEGASEEEDGEEEVNDWEDVISAMKIASRSNGAPNGKHTETKAGYGNYVPILPKQSDDKMDFSNSGEHFLSSQLYSPVEFTCEPCQKQFPSRITLKNHIKDFHMGKCPYKCEYCGVEFLVRAEYDACMRYHKTDPLSTPLTLNDFKNESLREDRGGTTDDLKIEPTDLMCDICHRQFNSTSGLLRHKVRKHNQKSKKKYFIKGMKNAKCDICNREFSTQSYMQLHRKLHLRDDIGYKYKVFGRNRYIKNEEDDKKSEAETGNEKEDENYHQTDNQESNKAEEMEIEIKEEPIEDSSGSEN